MVPLLLALSLTQEPPRLLPAAISGRPAPVARFHDPAGFPPHTLDGLRSAQAGADWLHRQSLPTGRLLPGFDPRTGQPLDTDHDLRQATAALALAEAAAFTGDDRLGASAAQAVLGLLTLTRESNGVRTPTVPAERCNPVAFAATLALAVEALPNGPTAASDGLAAYLRTQVRPDGGVGCGGDPATVDREGLASAPGLTLRALLAVQHRTPTAGVPPILAFYRPVLRARYNADLAASLLPAAAELGDTAAVFELADRLCGEPASAASAGGLAAACTVCRRVGDVARYDRYRRATHAGLAAGRALQYTAYSTARLPPATAARLVGAVAAAPADPTARPDQAAGLVLAHLRFLASGAEGE